MERGRETNIFESEAMDLLKLQFTDLSGRTKMVEVTGGKIGRTLKEGCAINRFALEGLERQPGKPRAGASEAEAPAAGHQEAAEGLRLYLKPDLATLRAVSWEPGQVEIASVICDVCDKDQNPAWADPRSAYKRILDEAGKLGLELTLDFQCEFYLFHTDEEGRPTTITHEAAGYYDAGSIDLAEHVRSEIMICLREAGMEVDSAHHGLTPGQHSFLLPAKSGLEAADALVTFRMAVKSAAKRHGLHATFMPKPNMSGGGSGLHVGLTVGRMDGGDAGETLRYFEAGLLRHLRETLIFTNPLVNSYKRLAALRRPIFQPEFPAPVWERGCGGLVRAAGGERGGGRLEVLYPDPSANPYLALGAVIAAGISGVAGRSEVESRGELPELPGTLGVVIREFESNQFARRVFGERLCGRYLEERREEWERFSSYVTDWEIREYLYRC